MEAQANMEETDRVNPQERSTWRSGVRSAMRAASQLPGKGPTDVDDAPAPYVNHYPYHHHNQIFD